MAYTEFYCQNGGSNLNAGSTTNNTATYTSIHGNWTNATGVFTPTDGTTPASTVSVGMWASVYVDGASVGVWVGRISVVGAGVNGAITVNTSGIGAKPANQTGTATIKVGGAWQGPNAASGFPLTLASWGANVDATPHKARINLKNDQTYSMTAVFSITSGGIFAMQGYSSSEGDGGRATFDGGTSTGAILSSVGSAGSIIADIIFKTSITTGTASLVIATGRGTFVRCVFTGSRGKGLYLNSGPNLVSECEAYGNNTSNTSSQGGFYVDGGTTIFQRCVAHDNTGSNTSGFYVASNGVNIIGCIADTNGQSGISFNVADASAIAVDSCDLYNNGSDGINIVSGCTDPFWIENCNFIKNAGKGINNVSTVNIGYVFNCGYGAGTQANGSADTLNNLVTSGAVTYANDVTPWSDPANGVWNITLAAAKNAGRGAFTETAASYGPTVGYPDIGAAQANASGGEVSYNSAS